MGLLGTVSAIGTAAGLSIGGLLITTFGWSSIFALMAGGGLLAALLVGTLLPPSAAHNRRPEFDVCGASALMLTVCAFALATTLSPLTFVNGMLAGAAALGLAGFILIERRAAAPLVQLGMLQRPAMAAGLLSIGLVSAIVMTTLVVGPYHLTGVPGLDNATAGLVMAIGPATSALVGLPAGRVVDHHGPTFVTFSGLFALLAGTLAMMVLPESIGLAGYILSLVFITSGYALFQAAANTTLMATTLSQQRGVTSALLALARNVGLVTGASAMGALFAFGSATAAEAGLRVVFATAAVFVALALALSAWATRRAAAIGAVALPE